LEEPDGRSPQIAACAALAQEFFRILRERDTTAKTVWRKSAAASPLAGFAEQLSRDEAWGTSTTWSSSSALCTARQIPTVALPRPQCGLKAALKIEYRDSATLSPYLPKNPFFLPP
jgi:hypothetical protein